MKGEVYLDQANESQAFLETLSIETFLENIYEGSFLNLNHFRGVA